MEINQSIILKKVGNWLSQKLIIFELVATVIILITTLLRIITDFDMNVVFSMSCSILAMIYFFVAYSDLENKKSSKYFFVINYLSYWSCSLILIALLAKIESYPFADSLRISGIIVISISFLTVLISNKLDTGKIKFKQQLVIRLLVMVIIAIVLLAVPTKEIANINEKEKVEQYESN